MSKIEYVEKNFKPASMQVIQQANEILTHYAGDGYTLTLRQLYYQFVSRDLMANTERDYKRLGSIISDARMAGFIDWDHMTDRTREVKKPRTWADPQTLLLACANQYSEDRWLGQKYRPEVWVEKDALVEIIAQACKPWQVPFFSCRGYTSQSAMWQAAERLYAYEDEGQKSVIIHLGDHDPSGMDMTRDIIDRLQIFMGGTHVKRIALNMGQIDKYKPPPNPTKVTDSRAATYIQEYGHECWELDALEPDVLNDLIHKNIKKLIDDDLWDRALKQEAKGRNWLQSLASREEN